jgi:GMP synthase-like glutamine amidotransferase
MKIKERDLNKMFLKPIAGIITMTFCLIGMHDPIARDSPLSQSREESRRTEATRVSVQVAHDIRMSQQLPSKSVSPRKDLFLCIINTEKKEKAAGNGKSIQRALEAIGHCRVVIIPYTEASPERMATLKPDAIILTGQGTPWWEYTEAELTPVYRLIQQKRYPTLGICGGHQLIVKACGGQVAPIKRIKDAPGYAGCLRERGYVSVKLITNQDALMRDLPQEAYLWENHAEEVKSLPRDFILLAQGTQSKLQAIRHKEAPLFGVQFHPEHTDEEHILGKQLLLNFLQIAASVPSDLLTAEKSDSTTVDREGITSDKPGRR